MKVDSQPRYVVSMFPAARRLRRESGEPQAQSAFPAFLQYMCKPAACRQIQHWCGFAGSRSTASGVVGFSGVKDARKSVLIADASASADIHHAMKQKGDTLKAGLKQAESDPGAKPKQSSSEVIANAKQDGSKSRTTCPSI